MAIYCEKTKEKLILSTIQIGPDCVLGNKVYKIRASVEHTRTFFLTELRADHGEEEIASVLQAIRYPKLTVKPLHEQERDAILKAVTLFSGNIPAAAQALGIRKGTLYRKLRQYRTTARSSASRGATRNSS